MSPSRRLVRFRVPASWALGLLALFLARPTPLHYIFGLGMAAVGEAVRVWAAGHLQKEGGITRSGPYVWTRNPLYLGSFLIGMGFAVATARWEVVLLLGVLVIGVYLPVIRTEAAQLGRQYPGVYAEYARQVPLILPRPWRRPLRRGIESRQRFSWARTLVNREHVTLLGWLAVAALLGWKMV